MVAGERNSRSEATRSAMERAEGQNDEVRARAEALDAEIDGPRGRPKEEVGRAERAERGEERRARESACSLAACGELKMEPEETRAEMEFREIDRLTREMDGARIEAERSAGEIKDEINRAFQRLISHDILLRSPGSVLPDEDLGTTSRESRDMQTQTAVERVSWTAMSMASVMMTTKDAHSSAEQNVSQLHVENASHLEEQLQWQSAGAPKPSLTEKISRLTRELEGAKLRCAQQEGEIATLREKQRSVEEGHRRSVEVRCRDEKTWEAQKAVLEKSMGAWRKKFEDFEASPLKEELEVARAERAILMEELQSVYNETRETGALMWQMRKLLVEKEALLEERALEAALVEEKDDAVEGKVNALTEKLSLVAERCAGLTFSNSKLDEKCCREMESCDEEMQTLVANMKRLTEKCNGTSAERSSLKEKIVALNRSLLCHEDLTRGEEEMKMHIRCLTEQCEVVDSERATLVEKVLLLEKALERLEEGNKSLRESKQLTNAKCHKLDKLIEEVTEKSAIEKGGIMDDMKCLKQECENIKVEKEIFKRTTFDRELNSLRGEKKVLVESKLELDAKYTLATRKNRYLESEICRLESKISQSEESEIHQSKESEICQSKGSDNEVETDGAIEQKKNPTRRFHDALVPPMGISHGRSAAPT